MKLKTFSLIIFCWVTGEEEQKITISRKTSSLHQLRATDASPKEENLTQ